MSGPAEFLAARLDEKEAALEDPQWGDAHGICYECGTSQDRERRGVAAMRAILAQWEASPPDSPVLTFAIYNLAAIWSDHPDYKKAWR